MKKIIDWLLDGISGFQMSCILLAISFVIIFRAVFGIMVTGEKYDLTELKFTSEEGALGFIDHGKEGIFSYGPYTNIGMGNYKVIIEYESDVDVSFDVIYKNSAEQILKITSGKLSHEKHSMKKVFYSGQIVDNNSFEIRTLYPGHGSFQLKEIKVKRCFVFKWYMLVTLATAAIALLLFRRRGLLTIMERPKEVFYFILLYVSLILLGIHAMAYVQGQGKSGPYILADLLIVLHAYGAKREVYQYMTRKNVSVVFSYIYLIGSLYALDLIMRYTTAADTDMSYADSVPNFFTFCILACIAVIISLIPKLWIKRLVYGVIYYIFLILLIVQTIYYRVFGKFFSFKDILLAKEGSDYSDYVFSLIDAKFIRMVILLILTGVIGILLMKEILRMRKEWYLISGSVILSVMIYNHTIYEGDFGEWNSFENANYIYSTMTNRLGAFKLCGFYQYELKDLRLSLFGSGGSQKETVKEVDDFFEARQKEETAQKENSMTGLFEGKNVIFFLMESIDDIACNEEVMPNLYRMSQEGINFSNFYASIYGTAATMNSELVTNVGMYAPLDGSMVYSFSDNSFPYSLAKRFTAAGYTARQYHFNKASFYNRQFMNEAFGYKEYVSYMDYMDKGYMKDTALVENNDLYQALIQDQPFLDYVITYSAHLSYDVADELVRSSLEKYPYYSDMTSSEEVNNYFAKSRITDEMLGGLIQKLEVNGLMEDTVIVAVGDHYPYGIMDEEALYELSGVQQYEQLLYKVPCVIWTPHMEAMNVDKVSSTIDLVPTLINLMGMGDTSVYLGHDIFDENYEGMAYFADGSWLTNDCYYHDGELVYGELSEEEIEKNNQYVMDVISANDNILKSDYYHHRK